MLFSGKLFTIFSAILAVAVNGSPVGFAEGELQAVRSPRGALDIDGGETWILTVLFPQRSLGNVEYCSGVDLSGECKQTSVDESCNNVSGGAVKSFKHDGNMICTAFQYVSSPTATERQIF